MRYRITQTGKRLMAVSTSGTPTTLPLCDDGSTARHVRVVAEPYTAAGSCAYVRVFASTLGTACTVTNADAAVTSHDAVVLETRGFQYINAMSPSTTVFVNVTPLENG